MALTEPTRRRMALIRYLYAEAIDQEKQPEPLCALAVLSMHDAVEMLLLLICEENDISPPASGRFMDYWNTCEPKFRLPHKKKMDRLNAVRNSLKHKGALPSKAEVSDLLAATGSFLDECASQILGTSLDNVSMADLIQYEKCRAEVERASVAAAAGHLEEAMDRVAMAFDLLIQEYEDGARTHRGRSVFTVGEEFGYWFGAAENQVPYFGFLDRVVVTVKAMQHSLKIMGLGIDFRRYAKFRFLTPTVLHPEGTAGKLYLCRRRRPRSKDEYDFCERFVIECALHLQSFTMEIGDLDTDDSDADEVVVYIHGEPQGTP